MTDYKFLDLDDPGAYSSKSDFFGFKVTLVMHGRKLLAAGSKEFTGGYWQTKVSHLGKEGGVPILEKFYVPDSREEYCNTIAILYDMIIPYLDKDNALLCEQLDADIEKLRLDFIESSKLKETEILTSENYKGEDLIRLEEYKFKKVRAYRKLLRQLFIFLQKRNWFEIKGISL